MASGSWGLLSREASSGIGQRERRVWPEAAGSDFPGTMRDSWNPQNWSHCDTKVFSELESEQPSPEPRDR